MPYACCAHAHAYAHAHMHLVLLHHWQVLKDDRSLQHYKLEDGVVVHLVARPEGATANMANDEPPALEAPRQPPRGFAPPGMLLGTVTLPEGQGLDLTTIMNSMLGGIGQTLAIAPQGSAGRARGGPAAPVSSAAPSVHLCARSPPLHPLCTTSLPCSLRPLCGPSTPSLHPSAALGTPLHPLCVPSLCFCFCFYTPWLGGGCAPSPRTVAWWQALGATDTDEAQDGEELAGWAHVRQCEGILEVLCVHACIYMNMMCAGAHDMTRRAHGACTAHFAARSAGARARPDALDGRALQRRRRTGLGRRQPALRATARHRLRAAPAPRVPPLVTTHPPPL